MYKVLTCLAYDHNWSQLCLALLLCFSSAFVAVTLLQRARRTGGIARVVWMASSGIAGGFGIWATHFVAMLAYDPGVIASYRVTPTFMSLLVAIVSIWASVVSMIWLDRRSGSIVAGVMFGFGISLMHFMGMTAIEIPGYIVWDQSLVFTAIVFAIVLSLPAFFLMQNMAPGPKSVVVGTALLALAILAMHFTGMGAVSVVPGISLAEPSETLSPTMLSTIVATIAFALLFSGACAAIFALRAERFERRNEEAFQLIVNGIADYAIYMLDAEGRISTWNAGAEKAKGYRREEAIGMHFNLVYPPDERAAGLPAKHLRIAREEGRFEIESWRVRKDGTRFWAHVIIQAVYSDGQFIGFAKITRDCTKQMLAASSLKKASDDLDMAMSHMANGLSMFDADNRLVLHNRRMAEILDLNPDLCLQGRTLRELCDLNEDAVGDRYVAYQELINSCQPGEVTVELASGKALKVMHSPIQGGAFVLTIEDVTERVRSEQKIIHMARHDALTGLPNRRQFVDALDLAVSHADVLTRKVAVIGIDLDRFKEINDTYGHAVGDEVLCVLSKRMENGLRKDELVARAGGDEFTAFKVFTEQSELQEFVDRLSLALSERIVLPTGDIVPGGSLGIAVYPNDATDRERLLANADMAMYRAKESMDEHACYYESSMDEAERARRMLGQDIWKAMEEGQFFLHFQVQRAAVSNVLTGYEVLLRWQHPERGLIPPNDFIPVAEQCGAISALGEWVLRKACEEAASWPLQEKIAVNLSPLQLTNVQLVDKLRQILLDTGMAAERLELEVTESAIIGDKTRALHILRQIKAMGVTIAIDDFGTGYSSLETLRSFPFDKIKLDRSFVADLGSDRQAKAFVRAIVALGKSLDVPVLAEGVETAQQAQVLTEEGCDQFQGYFLGRPDRLEIVARVTDKIAVAQG